MSGISSLQQVGTLCCCLYLYHGTYSGTAAAHQAYCNPTHPCASSALSCRAADGQPIYYINQARIASGNIYAGQSIIHQMAGMIVAPSKQLLLNAALKTSGWSDSNPAATVNLSPNGPEQQVVQEPAAEEPAAEEPATEEPAAEELATEEPAAEQPAPTTGEDTQAPSDSDITYDDQPSDSDITYEQEPQTGDVDMGYEYGGDAETKPSQEVPVPTVPATDEEPMPAPPATPAPTTTAPAQPQQPSVPVTVVPAPSTPQQQPDPSISLEQAKVNTTTPAAPTTTAGTSKPAPAVSPAPVTAKPAATATVAAPAATTTTTSSTGLSPAKTTSASSSVVVSAVAAVVPVVMALMMLA
jgi:hypothetical protein